MNTIARLRLHGLPRPGDARRKAREALATASRTEAAVQALCQMMAAGSSEPPEATYSDPVVARIQARRKRIADSGFRLIDGGAA
jgi:hypothetical protein